MKRSSRLISFLLVLVMLFGVFFVLPKDVRADVFDKYYIDDSTDVKVKDGCAKMFFTPVDTGYYIFYCSARGENYSSNSTDPMVVETGTSLGLFPFFGSFPFDLCLL